MVRPQTSQLAEYKEAYREVMSMALQEFAVFVITFIMYPGVSYSTSFEFLEHNKAKTTWFVVIMSCLFNVFDTVGRALAQMKMIFNEKTIIILTIFRLIFIATFIMIAKD